MDQNKTQLSPYPPYGPYPLNSNSIRGYKPSFSKNQTCAPPYLPILPLKPPLKLGYWELLSPALLGTAGALFLSLFSGEKSGEEEDDSIEPFGGSLFKLALVGYGIGATVAVAFAISDIISNFKPPCKNLVYPIGGAMVSVILLFASEYLVLYRYFPSSFKGYLGDNIVIQFISFLYLSVTTLATADLGDILPTNTTPRLLIATEIAFNLFVLAAGIQLLLAQKG